MSASQNNARYPYTYAADYLRMSLGRETDLSRREVSYLLTLIAEASDLDKRQLCCNLADTFIEHENDLVEKTAERVSQNLSA